MQFSICMFPLDTVNIFTTKKRENRIKLLINCMTQAINAKEQHYARKFYFSLFPYMRKFRKLS